MGSSREEQGGNNHDGQACRIDGREDDDVNAERYYKQRREMEFTPSLRQAVKIEGPDGCFRTQRVCERNPRTFVRRDADRWTLNSITLPVLRTQKLSVETYVDSDEIGIRKE